MAVSIFLINYFSAPSEAIKEVGIKKVQETSNSPEVLTSAKLSLFSSTTVEKRCPFYKPNGAEYRECLSTWVTELEKGLLVEQLDEVQNYCRNFIKNISDEDSNEGIELFLVCEIYTLK